MCGGVRVEVADGPLATGNSMHQAAESKIIGSLRTLLARSAVTTYGWIDFDFLREIDPAASTLQQQKRDLLTHEEARSALFDAVNYELAKRGIKATDDHEQLVNLISSQQIEEIAGAATDFLDSLPRPLDVDTPFAQIEGIDAAGLELVPGLNLVWRESSSTLAIAAPQAALVGVSRVNGIPTPLFSSRTLLEGFDLARAVMGTWLALDILFARPNLFSMAPTVARNGYRIFDATDSFERTANSAELDRRAAFVSTLLVNRKTSRNYLGDRKVDGETVAELASKTLGQAFLDPAYREEASQVASAAHWLFESTLADDESTQFIFACIGIEAIAGGGDPSQPLGQRISDRVSYLLCHRPSQRKHMAEKLTAIFKVRGKIVHGQIRRLSYPELATGREAREILRLLINAELRNINGLQS